MTSVSFIRLEDVDSEKGFRASEGGSRGRKLSEKVVKRMVEKELQGQGGAKDQQRRYVSDGNTARQ